MNYRFKQLVATIFIFTISNSCFSADAAEIFRNAHTSLVRLETFDANKTLLQRFSGVAVTNEDVVTTCHTLTNAKRTVAYRGALSAEAALLFQDSERDLCQLHISGLELVPVRLISLDRLAIGQRVFAIGFSIGLDPAISDGVLSAVRETKNEKYLQHSAPTTAGSNGGGLFIESGELAGITVFIPSTGGQNIAFAQPTNWITELRERSAVSATERTTAPTADFNSDAIILRSKRDWPSLLDFAKKWIVLDPKSADAFFNLGFAHDALGAMEPAIEAYAAAIERNDRVLYAWINIARLYILTGRIDDALKAVQSALNLAPQNADALVALGNYYMAKKQPDEGLKTFTQATESDPWNISAWLSVGTYYVNQQRYMDAIDPLRKVALIGGEAHGVWITLGDCYNRTKQPQRARDALNIATRANPRNVYAWTLLAIALRNLKQPMHAMDAVETALRLRPSKEVYASALFIKGTILGESGQHSAATVAYTEALAADPTLLYVREYLSREYRFVGQSKPAIELLEKWLQVKPEQPALLWELGEHYLMMDQPARAIDVYTRALSQSPAELRYWNRMGYAYHLLGDRSHVRDTYVQIKSLDRPAADAFYAELMLPYGDAR